MKLVHTYLIAVFSLVLMNCEKDFDEINTPRTGAVTTEPDGLFTVATQRGSMTWYMYDRLQRYIGNQYMQYNTITGSGGLDHYEPNYGMFSDIWDRMYGDQSWEIAPLFYVTHTIDICIERQNPHKEGIARIWRAYLFQRMTDLYGDIPYSEAFRSPLPKFDSQESIYLDLIDQLNLGKSLLKEPGNYASYGNADLIYNGDLTKWEKFANTLLLRIALRIENVAPQVTQNVMNDLADAVFMESNTDSNKMQWDATSSNIYFRNPILVTEVFNNTRMSAHLVDFLKETQDPRLSVYAKPAKTDNEYRGLENGLDPNEQTVFDLEYFDQYSRVGEAFLKEDGATYNLHFAESCFLRAEAAHKGYLNEDAAQLYNLGIRAAMEMYDISDDSIINNYLTQPEIQFNTTNGLEQIITQKWISLCMNGIEAWFEKRRTGFPELSPLQFKGSINNGVFPRRLTYSDAERRLNPENVLNAVEKMGGDTQEIRVWWDVSN
jgi:hypothetical protein